MLATAHKLRSAHTSNRIRKKAIAEYNFAIYCMKITDKEASKNNKREDMEID